MSMQLKVNISKGWPSPAIVEESALPNTGVTIEAGMVGSIDSTTGKWKLGTLTVSSIPYIFLNDSGDPDAVRASIGVTANVPWGGVHGILFLSPIEVETIQYAGTPAVGDDLTINAAGKFAVATNGQLVSAICTAAPFAVSESTFIRLIPDVAKRFNGVTASGISGYSGASTSGYSGKSGYSGYSA
jgi:hypothetical protein